MKLALCLEYPIEQFGGTEVLVRELIHGLAPRHEIILVSNDSPAGLQKSSVAGKVREHVHWPAADATLSDARTLATKLADLKPDLAHFHFGGTFAWGSRRPGFAPPIHLDRMGVPCLATNHGVFGVLEGYIGAQRSLLTKLALLPPAWASRLQLISHLRAEVAVSDNDLRALCARYWPFRSKFCRIYHSRIRESQTVETKERSKTILCVGTLGPRKGQPFLARAFREIAAEVPEWKLLFIGRAGDEQTTDELRRIMDLPLMKERIEWIPGCSDLELRRWFSAVEIFAMPSMHEGLGLTLQEALYHGCACIASRIGGIQDLIQDGTNGILVEPGHVEALARGLNSLIQDEPLRRQFAARGPQWILEKEMTAEKMVLKYEDLYSTIVSAT